jgi:hypothetical protein
LTLSVDNAYYTSTPQYYIIVYQGYTIAFYWYLYLLFCSAANGNLYVTAYKSNNLHCFTPDGKHKGIMLKKKDGLNEPYGIAFSKMSSPEVEYIISA